MMNMGNMMRQAQAMQQKMADMQKRLQETEVTGQSGGGMVQAVMNGGGTLKSLTIDPELIKADEKDILEDLIVAAVNDARQKTEELAQQESQKIMGGMQLPPGLKGMFG